MLAEDQLALVNEIVPRTLRSLFVLRISLCAVTAFFALLKVACSQPASGIILDLSVDPTNTNGRELITTWITDLNLLFSGLLASALALVIATFFIQARIRGHAEDEASEVVPVPSAS